MSEYRKDLLSDRWVIIAENRAKRPDQFQPPEMRRIVAPCPFCTGHENETPPATASYPSQDQATNAWQVRVVPNRFPAVRLNSEETGSGEGPHESRGGVGAHEVIIETPKHVVSLSELTDQQLRYTFSAYQERLRHWREDKRLVYGLVFKNARSAGGASLEHTHSQLIATSLVPREAAVEWALAEAYQRDHGKCPICEMLRHELLAEQRIVAVTQRYAAYCPYASRFPYETWVVPRPHAPRFEEISPDDRDEFAQLVCQVIRRLESLLGEPAYNYWIHSTPWCYPQADLFHWHLELVPRLTRLAGFELGAGYFINSVSPEEAASRLRSG